MNEVRPTSSLQPIDGDLINSFGISGGCNCICSMRNIPAVRSTMEIKLGRYEQSVHTLTGIFARCPACFYNFEGVAAAEHVHYMGELVDELQCYAVCSSMGLIMEECS